MWCFNVLTENMKLGACGLGLRVKGVTILPKKASSTSGHEHGPEIRQSLPSILGIRGWGFHE